MKHAVVLILLLANVGDALAQKDSIYVWNRYCTRNDTLLIFSEARNEVCFYSPKINPSDILLVGNNNPIDDSQVDIQGDTLVYSPSFYYNPPKRLVVVVKNKRKKKTYRTLDFAISKLDGYRFRPGNITEQQAYRNELLQPDNLQVICPNLLYKYPLLSISAYTFKTTQDGNKVSLYITGSRITDEIKELIRSAPRGTILEFTDILILRPDTKAWRMEGFKIVVK